MRRLVIAMLMLLVGCGSEDSNERSRDAGTDSVGEAESDGVAEALPGCGNGVTDPGEGCDDGSENGAGKGCETNCQPSCGSDGECDDQNQCNGLEHCAPVRTGRACDASPAPPEGSNCAGGYCKQGACVAAVCGNGAVEPGEACDPPNSAGCSAKCQICGDGKTAGDEQCDDANTSNLDGCDSSCRYETVMRMTKLVVSTDPGPAFCVHPANAFGTALGKEVADAISNSVNAATNGGFNNMLLDFGGLDDLTGTDAPSLSLGIVSGTLDPRVKSLWVPGKIDSWFVASPELLDAADQPKSLFSSSVIDAHALYGGPASVNVTVVFGTTVTNINTLFSTVSATIDTTPAPDIPAPPPAELAPGLAVFRSLTATGPDQGFCGVFTLESLANLVMPEDFALGANACSASCIDSHAYTYCGSGQPIGPTCNSMLDVLIGGCKVTALCITAVKPTQPDVGTNGNPPSVLSLGPYNKVSPTVPNDGYSIHFGFTANRAHLTNNLK